MSYPEFNLTDQVALITGASKGIGYGIAKALAHAGAKVAVSARSRTDLETLAREIGAEGGAARVFELDVGDTASINACVNAVQNVYGRLDILVNNAGLGANHPAVDVTEADWDEMMSVNLRGSLLLLSGSGPHYASTGTWTDHQHEFSGQCGRHPRSRRLLRIQGRRQSAYSCSCTRVVLQGRHGKRGCATFIYTPGTAERLDDAAYLQNVLARIPIGRVGSITDVAAAVIYLASPAGALVTGSVLMVDGGWTAQ